jgi:transmembrane sensor
MECKRRLPTGASHPAPKRKQWVPFEIRDVRTDDPTLVELDSAGARSTMTRATDIEQRATLWIIRSEGGNFTPGMRAELERWLQEPRNRVTFLRIKEAWRRAGRLRSARPLDGNVDPDLLKNSDLTFGPQNINSGGGWPLRVAAGAALTLIIYLVGLAAWVALGPSDWIKYTTSIGGYEHITLADGSGIQLNTDSEIRARLTPQRREIELIRGEALIEVVHDVRRPFTINAANIRVHADPAAKATAAFVVRLRTPRGVDVSVTQGSVVLEPYDKIIDVVFRRNPSYPSTSYPSTLAQGDAAAVRPEGIHLAKVGLEELNRKLSWTAGLLSFQGETLTQVTDEFNRYNRKHLVVTDPAIADRKIGGAFQATDPDSFVLALEKWFGVHADEQVPTPSGNTVIRLGSAK